MNLFFDTSALVKFFHEETGTSSITSLITDPENAIWILNLANIEFRCALYRRFRNQQINEEQLNRATRGFSAQLAYFHVEPIGEGVISEAEQLLNNYGKQWGLRTLDALHLGTFQLIAEKEWRFVTTDSKLADIAKVTGADVINPLNE